MALTFKKGSFTANNTTSTQDITDVGFQPVAYILFCTKLTAEGYGNDQFISIGFTDGTNQRCTSWGCTNGVSTTAVATSARTTTVLDYSAGQASHSAFLSNGFRISWSVATTVLVHYIAFGGTDIANVLVTSSPAISGTGSKAITGLSFQPDAAIFLFAGTQGTNNGVFSVGAAASSSKRWATSIAAITGATMASTFLVRRYERTDSVILATLGGSMSDTEEIRADFTSFDSGGLTLNVITDLNGFTYFVLLFKTGGKFDVGNFAKSTGAGATDTITPSLGVGNNPVGIIEATYGFSASASPLASSRLSFGGFDATSQGLAWGATGDVTLPTAATSRFVTTKTVSIGGATTTNAECDGAISGATFTNTWTTQDGSNEEILWMAFGSGPTSNIKAVAGVTYANISKVSGVAKASISKVAGLA